MLFFKKNIEKNNFKIYSSIKLNKTFQKTKNTKNINKKDKNLFPQ